MLAAADLNLPEDTAQFMLSFWEELASLDEEEGRAEARGKLRAFAEERVLGVLSNLKEIDDALVSHLDKWDLYRLGTVERAVLRMGVWEMKWSDVPKPVVINEAVDLVNWFSSPRSRTLVNGVLDRLGKELGRQGV